MMIFLGDVARSFQIAQALSLRLSSPISRLRQPWLTRQTTGAEKMAVSCTNMADFVRRRQCIER